jgi:hypothetical protein
MVLYGFAPEYKITIIDRPTAIAIPENKQESNFKKRLLREEGEKDQHK